MASHTPQEAMGPCEVCPQRWQGIAANAVGKYFRLPSPYVGKQHFLPSKVLRHQAHKELYAYKQVILKEKVKELNLHEICAVCLEEFKPKDELGICPCKHAFHRKCLIKWLEVRKVCPLCNMPVLQLAQLHSKQDHPGPPQEPLPGAANLV
ncbi:UNVERIFIED_CONTAM: RING finger protein 24 [Gekko kuhli]